MISTASFAQKFAYVDTDYILNNIPEFSQAQDKLDALSSEIYSGSHCTLTASHSSVVSIPSIIPSVDFAETIKFSPSSFIA